jgi:hypothetical protein
MFGSGYAQIRDTTLTPPEMWSSRSASVYAGTTLVFRDMDTSLNLISVEIQPLSGLSVEFEGGDNRFSGGTFSETAWLDAPRNTLHLLNSVIWVSPEHQEYAETRADLDGSTRLYSLNAYFRIYKSPPRVFGREAEPAHRLDLSAGYNWYRDDIRIFNGDNTLSTSFFIPTPPRGAFPNLDSTYKMTWSGWRVGVREQARIYGTFSMEGKFYFGPVMSYRGEGWWNLRTDLSNPGYSETATGHMVEFSASAAWKFLKDLQLEGGYLGWLYNAVSGSRRVLYANGTGSTVKLDAIKTARKGWYLGLAWKY